MKESLQAKCERIGRQLVNIRPTISCPDCRRPILSDEIDEYAGRCRSCFMTNQGLISARISTIPSRWQWKSPTPYKHQVSSYKKAFAWLEAESKKWLYIYGLSGVGKSHLAAVIANRYIGQKSLYWLSYYDFVFASYQTKNQFLSNIKKASLIVIDGFGAIGSMPAMMEAIFDYCLNQGVRIIFTTQVYLLKSQQQEKLIKPSDRMEPYIAELLIEGISTYLLMDGRNLRLLSVEG